MELPKEIKSFLRDQEFYLLTDYEVEMNRPFRKCEYTKKPIPSNVLHYSITSTLGKIVIECKDDFSKLRIVENTMGEINDN